MRIHIQHHTCHSSQGNKARKRHKDILTEKKEKKLPLFIDDMITYIENPKNSTNKLLEGISEFSMVARYIISIWSQIIFTFQQWTVGIWNKKFSNTPQNKILKNKSHRICVDTVCWKRKKKKYCDERNKK